MKICLIRQRCKWKSIKYFIDNLDGLGKELNNTIAKLKEIKDQKANNDQEIKKNEELLNWIKGIEDQMNRVLEF